MVTFGYTNQYLTEIELLESGGGGYSALANFTLDLDAAFAAFAQNEGSGAPPEILSLESDRIEVAIDGYTFVLTGSGIGPATNLDELCEAIDGGIATGAFSTVVMTGPVSIGGPTGEILRFTAAANGTGYTLATGGQSVVVTGALPNTLVGLADMLRSIGQLGTLFELTPTEQQTLATELNSYGVTGLQLFDDASSVISIAITPTSFTLNFGAMTLVVNGTMPTNFGDLVRIALQIDSIETMNGYFTSLADVDGLSIDSARLSGPNDVTLLTVTGPITDEGSLDNAVITFNGTVVGEFWTGTQSSDYWGALPGQSVRAHGFAGDDVLSGSDLADIIFGGTGDDTLFGNSGNDKIYGEDGNDRVEGGDGNDLLYTGSGNDIARGGAGRDLIGASEGNDLVYGDSGNDTLLGGAGNDTVYGGADNDYLRGDDGNDLLFGDEGVDRLYGSAGNDTLFGGADNDAVWGSSGNDSLYGGDGNDRIGGGGWADGMFGGAGNDTMWGGTGNDTIYGNDGNDFVIGGDDNDLMYGGAGRDTLRGEAGDDFLSGDEGNDSLTGDDGNDRLFGGMGNDTLIGGTGDDRLGGDDGNDLIRAGNGDDILWGGAGDDTLSSDDGNDILWDGDGNDSIYGGNGDDQFFSGGGNDLLIGGSGADHFIFRGDFGTDRVRDFTVAEGDTLTLSSALWGGTTLTAAQMLASYATVTSNGVVLNFGAGDTITLEGLTSTIGLDSAIDFTL
jgi:Ca2+-binding RTX toxin-like protein